MTGTVCHSRIIKQHNKKNGHRPCHVEQGRDISKNKGILRQAQNDSDIKRDGHGWAE